MTLGLAALGWAAFFGILGIGAFGLSGGAVAGIALTVGAIAGVGVVVWCAIQLVQWPGARLAIFRDRLLVIEGRTEMRALWGRMESVTLTDPNAWPSVRLTDRLTIQLRDEEPLSFKPARVGLDPVACRDLILRLRDDPKLRTRLPEFDSLRDLAVSPVVAGELIEPRI